MLFEELGDGEDLDPPVVATGQVGVVDAGGRGLQAHRRGRLVEGDEQADLGLLALGDALEVADHARVHAPLLTLTAPDRPRRAARSRKLEPVTHTSSTTNAPSVIRFGMS